MVGSFEEKPQLPATQPPLTGGAAVPSTDSSMTLEHYHAGFIAGGPPAKVSDSDLDMIVNVTREYPFDYATVMFGYIMPFVLVLTLITNTLVVMVLAQRHMRTPTNIVLFTMAIVDLMTLLSPSPWYFYIYTLGYHDKFLYPPVLCYAHHFMTDVIPVFFHTSSIWLALLLAGQRYIYVCHPSLASTWCTVPRVRRAIIIILVIAFLHQITRFFDNKFESVSVQYNQVQHSACKNEISEWVQAIDIGVYYITYFTFRIVFVFIIPCVALITLNCLLFRALRRAENKRSELLKTKFKLVGGNRSSVAGCYANDGRQSSFFGANSVVKSTEHPSTATTNNNILSGSSLYWPTQRKASSPVVRLNRTADEVEHAATGEGSLQQRTCGRFSISASFRVRRSFVADYQRQFSPKVAGPENQPLGNNDSPRRMQMSPLSRQTHAKSPSRTKIEARGFGDMTAQSDSENSDHRLMITADDSGEPQRVSPLVAAAASRCTIREQGKQRSKESNESYSVVSINQSVRDRDHSKSKLSSDNQSTNGRDDDYSCPGCAACDQQQSDDHEDLDEDSGECRRCLASSLNRAEGAAHTGSGGHHQHQAVSQCSSLINGTTNDEVSSCGHNNSSSMMYAVHDGTLDGIETGSIREDGEGLLETERESTSMHNSGNNNNGDESTHDKQRHKRNKKSISADGDPSAKGADADLMKSSSIDSRLVCGCPLSPDRTKTNLYRCSRSNWSRREVAACRECCLASRCRRQSGKLREAIAASRHQSVRSRGSMQKQACIAASCSSSDPCIKCNNLTQDSSGCRATGRQPVAKQSSMAVAGSKKKHTISQSKSEHYYPSGQGARCTGDAGSADASAGGELCSDPEAANKRRSQADIYLDGNAAATTTTTTTLYSTQANSIASLVQKQAASAGESQQALHQTTGSLMAHASSPSFVSTVIGRGSRATLLGGSSGIGTGNGHGNLTSSGSMNPPPALVITGGNPTASLRTMDSNRTTLMLIVVVTVFLMVEVPVAIVTILHVILNTFDAFKDVEFSAYLNYIKLFTNFFIMISYSVNFTIYCSMSKKFRETFRDLVFCGKEGRRKGAAGHLSHSQYINHNNSHHHHQLHHQPSHEAMAQGPLSQSNSHNATSLAAPGSRQPNSSSNEQTRYSTPYRMRANSQQQECEL